MEKDILSIFVANEITISLITKLYRCALALLLLGTVYYIFDLVEWYSLLEKTTATVKSNPHYFYSYKLRPVISVILMACSTSGQILNYKGYGYISTGIKSHDLILLNKGFRNFYTTYILAFISFSVSIISIGYRVLR